MAMKKDPPEETDSGSWMDTYGDLVTNLLCFFVLLFAMSSVDSAKWAELVTSFSGTPPIMAPLNPGTGSPMDDLISQFPTPQPGVTPTIPPSPIPTLTWEEWMSLLQFGELYDRIVAYVDYENLEMFVEVTKEADLITIRFTDSLLFDSGRADIRPEGLDVLAALMPILVDSQDAIRIIHVEGHTDNVPIRSAAFPSNWELSTARAVRVLRYIADNTDMDPSLLTAAGYGEYHPVDTNDNEAGKARNRRVEISIERKSLGTDVADWVGPSYSLPTATPPPLEELDPFADVMPGIED